MFIWLPVLLLPAVAWLLKGRMVPVGSMLLRPGERLRVVQNDRTPVRQSAGRPLIKVP
jgi:hypothetical protein